MKVTQEFYGAILKSGLYRKLPHGDIKAVNMTNELTICDNRVIARLVAVDTELNDREFPLTRKNVRCAVASIAKTIGFKTGKNQINAVA